MQVDVGTGFVGQFLFGYLTENGRRIPILSQISISGSVEYLGIPDFHRTGGPFWAKNLLYPCSSWGDGGTPTNQDWVVQPGGPYVSVAVVWHGAVPARSAYIPRSPENARASLRHVCDDYL